MLEVFADRVAFLVPAYASPSFGESRKGKYRPCSVIRAGTMLSYFHRIEERGSGFGGCATKCSITVWITASRHGHRLFSGRVPGPAKSGSHPCLGNPTHGDTGHRSAVERTTEKIIAQIAKADTLRAVGVSHLDVVKDTAIVTGRACRFANTGSHRTRTKRCLPAKGGAC